MTNTEKLFYQDVYLKEFTASVLSCCEKNGRYEVILDRTAFYPEGGGQPSDTGGLGGAAVLDVQYAKSEELSGSSELSEPSGSSQPAQSPEEVIVHITDKPLAAGGEVTGRVNWTRRFDLMQQHSGEHIVSGMIHDKYGYNNVGFHMGEEMITIDLSGVLTMEQALEIEAKVNEYIWENHDVNIFYPDEEARKTLPYRSKKELTGEVRLVEFPGADLCACCGLHVTHTGEIGLVKIISCKKFRDGVRMEMLSGRRAYRWLSENAAQNTAVAVSLSVKDGETREAVGRLLDEIYELKGTLNQTRQKAFDIKAQSCAGKGNVLLFEEAMDASEIQKCTDAVLHTCGGIAVLLSGDDRSGYKYAAGQLDGNVRELVKKMNAALNGKGGGKPFFAQGYVRTTRAEAERFFAEEGFARAE